MVSLMSRTCCALLMAPIVARTRNGRTPGTLAGARASDQRSVLLGLRVDRDLGDADEQARRHGVGLEGLVQQRRRVLGDLDLGALEDRVAALGREGLEGAAVELEEERVGGRDLA